MKFVAISRATLTIEEARAALGATGGESPAQLKSMYIAKAHLAHPDKGGSTKMMQDVTEAYAILLGKVRPAPSKAGPAHDWRNPPEKKYEYNRPPPRPRQDPFRQPPRPQQPPPRQPPPPSDTEKRMKVSLQVKELVKKMKLDASKWKAFDLDKICPFPKTTYDFVGLTLEQAELLLKELLRIQYNPPPPREPEITREQAETLARLIEQLKLTTALKWAKANLNKICPFPKSVADLRQLSKVDAVKLIDALSKINEAHNDSKIVYQKRPQVSGEPTERARQRLYDAYDRAPGDHQSKFNKMLVALRTRIRATKEASKMRGIYNMLREEAENSRWSTAEKFVFSSIAEQIFKDQGWG